MCQICLICVMLSIHVSMFVCMYHKFPRNSTSTLYHCISLIFTVECICFLSTNQGFFSPLLLHLNISKHPCFISTHITLQIIIRINTCLQHVVKTLFFTPLPPHQTRTSFPKKHLKVNLCLIFHSFEKN